MNNGIRNVTSKLKACFFAATLLLTPYTVGAADTVKGFDQVFSLQSITFHVACPNEGSLF